MKAIIFNPTNIDTVYYSTPAMQQGCYDLMQVFFVGNEGGEPFDRMEVGAELVFDEVERVHRPALSRNREDIYLLTQRVIEQCDKRIATDHSALAEFLLDKERRDAVLETAMKTAQLNLSSAERQAIRADVDLVYDSYYPSRLFSPQSATGEVLLSPNAGVIRARIDCESRYSAGQMLALLGAAGLKVVLPSFEPEAKPDEIRALIAEIRRDCDGARKAYLDFIKGFVKDCHEQLRAGHYEDIAEYAEKALIFELENRLAAYTTAMQDSRLPAAAKAALRKETPTLLGIFGKALSGSFDLFGSLADLLKGFMAEHDARKSAVAAVSDMSYVCEVRARLAV